MSIGTTADHVITRNDIISGAIKKVRGWPEDGNLPIHKVRDAISSLNRLLRAESLKQTGLAKSLWALDTIALPLAAGRYIYGEDEGLSASIEEIHSVLFRDTSGGDLPIDWITAEVYALKDPKNETGDPSCVYLKKSRLLADQTLYVWPAPSSVTAGDTVIQDEVQYLCILKHTSASENQPGSGASWKIFWQVDEAASGSADTWATATDYDNGPLIILTFKRPLFDFDSPYDNPDFPLGWEDYLIYKLALRLAPDYQIGAEDRQLLRADLREIEADLFPSNRPSTSKTHNFSRFF